MKKIIAAVCVGLISAVAFPAAALQPLSSYNGGNAAGDDSQMPIDFCAQGKLLIFTGNCVLPEGSAFKDSISRKACEDVRSVLIAGLDVLYPQAKVYSYDDLDAEGVYSKLSAPSVRGFFLIGEGNVKGGMVLGERTEVLYPSQESCESGLDVFGGFTSHSKYSPDVSAPAELRRRMLARMEFIADGARSPSGSWPGICEPRLSLVYPTRTFAGRMKEDAKKLLAALMEKKREQAMGALESICGACDQYVKAGYPLAKLCPPNSDVCALKRITPGSEKLVMDNYCLVLHPEYAPQSR